MWGRVQNATLAGQVKELRAQNATLTTQCTAMQAQIDKLNTEVGKYKTKASEFELEAARANTRAAELERIHLLLLTDYKALLAQMHSVDSALRDRVGYQPSIKLS